MPRRLEVGSLPGCVLLASLLTVFDGVATWLLLRAGASEANPVVDSLIGVLGPTRALLLRTAWGLALVLGLALLARRTPWARAGLVVSLLGLAAVSGWHVGGGMAAMSGVVPGR